MGTSYIERIRKIAEALETTADHIEEKDSPSEADEERADLYREAIDALLQAIETLESLA